MPEKPHGSKTRETDTDEPESEAETEELKWRSPDEPPLTLSGFPWYATDGVFRRLPLDPVEPLPPSVHTLAGCTAGGQLRFQTDSRRLSLNVQLSGPANMYHMPATGQCGFDLYIGPPGNQRYRSTVHFDHAVVDYEVQLLAHGQSELRNLTINFPLYKGVRELAIGLDPGAEVRRASETLNEGARADREERMAFQRDTVEDLRAADDVRLFFFDGADMLGEDFDECTVDGTHPTDLGFLRMARSLEPAVRRIILP